MGSLTTALLLLLTTSSYHIAASSYRRVCYYTNWSQYRNGIGKFYPENTDPTLCTHLIYTFAFLNGNHLKAVEWNDESTPWMKGMYVRFNELKKRNPAVKTLLAVGGYTMGTMKFSQMVSTDANIHDFANDAVKFLRKNGFDGLDIDWEYPAFGGGPAGDRDRLIQLVKIVRSEFENEARTTGNPRLILSAALPAGKDKIDAGFNVPQFAKYMDMVNLMAYDLHGGSWEDHTGHNSPLYRSKLDTGINAYLNVEWVADYWVKLGMPPSMINLGLALYGRSFTLANPNNAGLYAPDIGNGGQEGRYTGERGYLAYYEICQMLSNGATRHYLTDQAVPYLVQGNQWVGYEDEDSIRLKVRHLMDGYFPFRIVDFAKKKGFGGIMIWALDTDDFTGSCGHGKYPLLHAAIDELTRSGSAPVRPTFAPTPKPSVALTTKTTTPPSMKPTTPFSVVTTHKVQVSNTFSCAGKPNGFYRNPLSCSNYYICAASRSFQIQCATGLYFNDLTKFCDFPRNVQCKQNVQTTAVPTSSTTSTTTSTTTTTPTPAPHPTVFRFSFTPQMTTTTTSSASQTAINLNSFCRTRQNGLFSHPNNCGLFIQCYSGLGFVEPCPPGLAFNENMKACDFPFRVPGCLNFQG